MSEDSDPKYDGPVLESPPTAEAPSAIASLFSDDDSIAIIASKLAIHESLLQVVTRDLKFHDFAREILVSVMKVVKCEAGSLLEVDQDNRHLFFRAVVGQSSDRVARFIIPIGQGIVGHVAESRQPLIVNNVGENRLYLKSIENAVGFEAQNLIALPLIIRGRVFGVLELLNRLGEPGFSPGDSDLLTYVCDVVSRIIEIRLMLSWASQSGGGKKEAA